MSAQMPQHVAADESLSTTWTSILERTGNSPTAPVTLSDTEAQSDDIQALVAAGGATMTSAGGVNTIQLVTEEVDPSEVQTSVRASAKKQPFAGGAATTPTTDQMVLDNAVDSATEGVQPAPESAPVADEVIAQSEEPTPAPVPAS